MCADDFAANNPLTTVSPPLHSSSLDSSIPESTLEYDERGLGEELYRAGSFAEASRVLARAVQGTPVSKSDVYLVRALNRIGDNKLAIAHARSVNKSSDGDPVSRARVLEAIGARAQAVEQLHDMARQQESSNTKYWHALIDMLMASRDWGAAWAIIEEANRKGITCVKLDRTRKRIERAALVTGTQLQLLSDGRFNGEFKSTETMLRSIVDRALSRPCPGFLNQSRPTDHIGHLILVISSLGAGGAERQIVNLANELVVDHRITRVTLLCTKLREQRDCFYLEALDPKVHVDTYYDQAREITLEAIPSLAAYADLLGNIQPRSRLQVLLQLAERLEHERADAVEGWMDETFINVVLTCAMLGHRNSVAGHWVNVPPEQDTQQDELKGDKARYLFNAYREIVRLPGIRYSSNSTLNGHAYARWLNLPMNSVATIHNGICEATLVGQTDSASECRASLGIPKNAMVIGSIMRLVDQKQPLLWVDVAGRLASLRPELHFVLLGEGNLRGEVEKRTRKHGIDNMHLCGNRKDVGAWLAAFDIFLLTSRIEGIPNAAIEAQLSGCPVIAQAVGGLSEVVRHRESGLLLSDENPDAIAQAVIQVLDSKKLRDKIVITARNEARQRHSLSSLRDAHILLHSSLTAPINA